MPADVEDRNEGNVKDIDNQSRRKCVSVAAALRANQGLYTRN